MKSITLLKVFVASPGDVIEERTVLEDVIRELNLTTADTHGYRLDLVKWETNTFPSVQGYDAQDIINKQIEDDYDIFIGIMWSRAGTATARAESGTIEEFRRAYNRTTNGENIDVMFYFNESPIPYDKIDADQFKTIQEFRASIGKEGTYYRAYKDSKDFESLVRLHLSMKLKDWEKNYGGQDVKGVVEVVDTEVIEEEGLLDVYSDIMQSSFYLITSLNSIQNSMNNFVDELQQRTDEVAKFNDSKNVGSMKMAVTKVSVVMDRFSDALEPEMDFLETNLGSCMDSFSKAIAMVRDFDNSYLSDVEFKKSVSELYTVLKGTNIAISQINDMLKSIPPIQKNMNNAKRKVSNQFSNLYKTINAALVTIQEIQDVFR